MNWGRSIIICLFVLCVSIARAGEPHHKWLLKDAPESYVVQDGDNLWDIACKFLHDPWRWEEIWQSNPEIQNPNLIFPGDRLVLSYMDGQPKLHVVRGHSNRTLDKRTGVIKLHPRVRELPSDKAIPPIPLHVIGPFLNESRVISQMQAERCPKIIALDEDHVVIGRGDLFYVKGLESTDPEDVFMVFRPSKTYLDPKSKAQLGIEGHVLAKAQIETPGKTARLIITKSYEEVKLGDRITGASKENINPLFFPKFPKGDAKGQIISVFGSMTQINPQDSAFGTITQIGQYQVIVLTGGKDRKRENGDVLSIYQTQKDLPLRLTEYSDKTYKFPPLNIGTCVVFRVFDKVSYALVMSAIRPIYLLDDVGRP